MGRNRIVDGHIHFTNVERTGEIGRMMNLLGVEKACCLSLISRERINHNPECLYLKSAYPGKIYAAGSLDYTAILNNDAGADRDLARQVEEMMSTGYDGAKMVEGKPSVYQWTGVPFDDPRYDRFFAALDAHRFPLVFHVGDPPSFWDPADEWSNAMGWNYAGGGFVSLDELYGQVERMLRRHPTLTVIFAHFFFLADDLDRAERYLAEFPNVHLDVTPGAEMYFQFSRSPEKTREFFIRWQDRIIYGTDVFIGSWGPRVAENDRYYEVIAGLRQFFSASGELAVFRPEDFSGYNIPRQGTLRGISLPPEALEKLFAGNFERLYGSVPKEIDRQRAVAECLRLSRRCRAHAEIVEKVLRHFRSG